MRASSRRFGNSLFGGALLLLGGAVASSCGGRSELEPAGDDAGTVQHDAGTAAVDAADAAAVDGGPIPYGGVVLASATQTGSTTSYSVFAAFASRPPPVIAACPAGEPGLGGCCCLHGVSTPPPVQPPDAANITVMSGKTGATLATLIPAQPKTGPSSTSLDLYETLDLGPAGNAFPGDYPPPVTQPWSPGDALGVVATGNQIAPFSATLRTGAPLSGVTPAIGSAPFVVDHTRSLDVSWTPEAGGDGTVLLVLQRLPNTCYCVASDSAGQLTLDASLLAPFGAASGSGNSAATGQIRIERLTTSTASASNATITLVGEVAQAAGATFQ